MNGIWKINGIEVEAATEARAITKFCKDSFGWQSVSVWPVKDGTVQVQKNPFIKETLTIETIKERPEYKYMISRRDI
jgi:hypothetical protein